jgi:hypothetical protein
MLRILYPADPVKDFLPDCVWREEFDTIQSNGYEASVITIGQQISIKPAIKAGDTVLYRGWMLNIDEYQILEYEIKKYGAKLFTTTESYRFCHHLPFWYPKIAHLTAETIILDENANFKEALANLKWPSYFIKDFVKSNSMSPGSLVKSKDDIQEVVLAIKKYRGCIEGGVCVRHGEDYLTNSEQRFFVVKGIAYSNTEKFSPKHATNPYTIPEILTECVHKIGFANGFFSVDIARRTDGKFRIIEIGDGQVSDPKNFDLKRFVDILPKEFKE